jgi:hypothetical protein
VKEDKWLTFVEEEAARQGFVFILDCGEGKNMPNPPPGFDDDIEELSGRLLTPEQASTLPHETREECEALLKIPDLPSITARWQATEDGGVAVVFETIPIYD